jgi:hypothetical protein
MDYHSKLERNVISNPNRYRILITFRKIAGRCNRFLGSCLFGLLFPFYSFGSGALSVADSTDHSVGEASDTTILQDPIKKTHGNHLVDWVFEKVKKEQKKVIEGGNTSIEYYRKFEGKTIAGIRIKPLSVFGPTFSDTTRIPSSNIESFVNKVNFSTNQKVLLKNIWFRKGDAVDPYILSENEQFIRNLPYIQDVSFLIDLNPFNPEEVFITILTKDVYSFGVAGKISGVTAGYLTLYNHNVFGIGHQLSVKFTGNLTKDQPLGIETYYAVNNLFGKLIDLKAGYVNSYIRSGFLIDIDREFQSSTTRWAGGLTFDRFFRNKKLASGDPVSTDSLLEYRYFDGWAGVNFPIARRKYHLGTQLTLTARISNTYFFDRPVADGNNEQFFADNTLYLFGLTHSTRNFQKSNLFYSYGITEDIPSGFLYELVGGFYDGEFLKRYYTHLVLSKGVVSPNQDYFYASLKFGGFWDNGEFGQGQMETNINYITKLFQIPYGFRVRQFLKLNYIRGINRFEIENLYLNNLSRQYGIRGFRNEDALGKQRLSLKTETVFFQKPALYGFKVAWYGFADFGLIGNNYESVFDQKFYSGIGAGIRIRNESLVFNTLQIQLGYYPGYNWGADLRGLGRTSFDRFQPGKPSPLLFE